MTKKLIFPVIGGVFLLAVIVLLVSNFFDRQNEPFFGDGSEPVIVNLADNNKATFKPEEYQANLQQVLARYWQNGDSVGIKDQLLALTTPSEFLDLHLDLVIAFELIEQGESSSDQEKLSGAKTKLEVLKTQYPWIANY